MKLSAPEELKRIQSVMYNHLGYVACFEKPVLEPSQSLQRIKNEMIQKYTGVTLEMLQMYGDKRVEEYSREHGELFPRSTEPWEVYMETDHVIAYKNVEETKFKIESKPTFRITEIKTDGRLIELEQQEAQGIWDEAVLACHERMMKTKGYYRFHKDLLKLLKTNHEQHN